MKKTARKSSFYGEKKEDRAGCRGIHLVEYMYIDAAYISSLFNDDDGDDDCCGLFCVVGVVF